MINLTTAQLDNLIAQSDATYDEVIGQAGDYNKYHAIAENIAELSFGVTDYDCNIVDERCILLGQLELDRMM